MKSLRHIFVLLLALVIFIMGAGTGVVHICSAYCKTQMCSSAFHDCISHGGDCCCHKSACGTEDVSDTSFSEQCSCLNLSYEIDFYKISQNDDSTDYIPVVIDILESFMYDIFRYTENPSYEIAINAPPYKCKGRTLLAMNSILII